MAEVKWARQASVANSNRSSQAKRGNEAMHRRLLPTTRAHLCSAALCCAVLWPPPVGEDGQLDGVALHSLLRLLCACSGPPPLQLDSHVLGGSDMSSAAGLHHDGADAVDEHGRACISTQAGQACNAGGRAESDSAGSVVMLQAHQVLSAGQAVQVRTADRHAYSSQARSEDAPCTSWPGRRSDSR